MEAAKFDAAHNGIKKCAYLRPPAERYATALPRTGGLSSDQIDDAEKLQGNLVAVFKTISLSNFPICRQNY